MSRKITWQRSFKVPKNKLNLFLTKIDFESNNIGYLEAEYIFQEKTHYDVVINSYELVHPWMVDRLQEFLNESET